MNAAITRLGRLFAALFLILALRQGYIALVAAPRLAAEPHNPRGIASAAGRGTIFARDGEPLASTSNHAACAML